jgi:hypothetical protein
VTLIKKADLNDYRAAQSKRNVLPFRRGVQSNAKPVSGKAQVDTGNKPPAGRQEIRSKHSLTVDGPAASARRV